MTDPYSCCEGTRLAGYSRRDFLWQTSMGALSLALIPALLADDQPGQAGALRKRAKQTVLVPIFLRGGADGLNMLVPHGDKHYYQLRRSIAIPANKALDLDGLFGLHPALGAWMPHFKNSTLTGLAAISHAKAGRSHFDEQDIWETGEVGNSVRSSGWLNRFLAEHAAEGPIRAVSFGSVLPRILRGKVPVQAVRSLAELRLLTKKSRRARTRAALAEAYGQASELLKNTGKETLDALKVLKKLDPEAYRPANSAVYPKTALGIQLRQAAQLIKARIGLEVIELELGGWDTHQNQGGIQGAQANLMRNLAQSTAAFLKDLGDDATNVLVMTLSEFGRTAAENGTRGTDHGHGNCLFLLGDGLQGGKVHGNWPGLAPEKLNEKRDLAHTADFRDVFSEVLERHMGCASASTVLHGYKASKHGLFKKA